VSKVDLHIHSTASDGRLSPAEIVCKSAEAGLTVIALADHDTVDGIAPALEAAKAFPWLKVIPSVEISTDIPKGEVHVLGYFIDYVGRPHIAQAMLEKGYIASLKEAFTKYISRDGPAYVEREKMSPVEVVELILRATGLPVLAHPFTVNDPEAMVIELKAGGLVGIEAYYDGYTAEEVNRLVSLAERHGLITTGGSDYHGLDDSAETMIGGAETPMGSAEQLIAMAERRVLKPASL